MEHPGADSRIAHRVRWRPFRPRGGGRTEAIPDSATSLPLYAVPRCLTLLVGVAAALALVPRSAMATPSGLNNIPTADVAPPGALVLQAFANLGDGQTEVLAAGFKYGLFPGLEIGVDDRLHAWGTGAGVTGAGGAPAGPAVLQLKYRLSVPGPVAVAVGAANLSADTESAGNPVPYGVVTYAAPGALRLHGGYEAQAGSPGWFAGADYSIGRLTVRADWTQTANQQESVSSLGGILTLNPHWLVEGWASWPTAADTNSTLTLKLDWVVAR